MKRLLIILLIAVAGFAVWQFPSWNAARAQLEIAEQRVDQIIADGSTTLDLTDLVELRRLPSNIENATKLVYLRLRGTHVSDISGVENLRNLQDVDLNQTRVTELTPLEGHPSLRVLYLHETWVEDLGVLASLPALERLDIGKTQVASLEPVTRIANLNWLNLHGSYALDGSTQFFETLAARMPDLSGGNSYRQGYRPDWQYQMTVRLRRLKERLGIASEPI